MRITVLTNVAANMIGKVWIAGLQLLFAPIYLFLLGSSSYGLLSFYTSLLLCLVFLDHAFSAILSRELARLNSDEDGMNRSRNLLFTLEVASGFIAIFLGLGLWCLSPYIANHWIHDNFFSEDRLIFLLRLMGISIACQWLTFLYNSGFAGLQRQDVATRLRIVLSTIQWGGAALVLWFFEPLVELFFFWQIFSLSLTTFVMRIGLWKQMPQASKLKFCTWTSLKPTLPFAFGSLGIGLTGAFIAQADKLLVAKYASLTQLAGYSLCFLAATLLIALVSHPICVSLIPHFTKLITSNQQKKLVEEHHFWTQSVAVVAFPITAALVFFPQALAFVWLPSGSPISKLMIEYTPWVASGTLFSVLTTFLYILETAAGKTRLLFVKNVITLIAILPVLIFFMPKHGPIIGAYCWLAANFCYYLFEAPIVHHRHVRGELWTWWFKDTLLPGIMVGAVFMVFHFFFQTLDAWLLVASTALITFLSMLMLMLALPLPREKFFAVLHRAKNQVHGP